MSTITKTLPGIDTDFFCLSQGVAEDDYMVFNGTASDPGASYSAGGYFRTLSFTSPDDLSAITIIIRGTSNGATITETIVGGPNNDTIYSTKCYDSVTQIQIADAAATNLSVGSGNITVIPYTFGPRVSTSFSCVQDSFGAFITNPNTVTIDISGTYRPLVPTEILALLSDTSGGVFSIHSGVATSYRLTSAETRGLSTIFFKIASTGATAIYLDLFTA